jgi:hypothetical protein
MAWRSLMDCDQPSRPGGAEARTVTEAGERHHPGHSPSPGNGHGRSARRGRRAECETEEGLDAGGVLTEPAHPR